MYTRNTNVGLEPITSTPEARLRMLEVRFAELEGRFERLVSSVDGIASYLHTRAQIERCGIEVITH